MAYNKYYLQKRQVSYDNGLTWEDVTPSETRQGAFIDSYETLSDCEGVIDYSKQYLTIESLADNNTISWNASHSAYTKTISVSNDNGLTWTEYPSTTGGTTIATLNAGDKLIIKGENENYGTSSQWNKFKTTGQFEVKGNIMSLVSGDSFVNADELTHSYTFFSLFGDCTGLTSVENLILSATNIRAYCYYQMFGGCTSLTKAPSVLPATTLVNYCYREMFGGCYNLTTAPALPATTLAAGCYRSMFNGCESLTTAPELPATTLQNYCYYQMFYNCSSLNYIKCLATYLSEGYSTSVWLSGVSSTGTFVKDANATWTTGSSGIPDGWTVIDNS